MPKIDEKSIVSEVTLRPGYYRWKHTLEGKTTIYSAMLKVGYVTGVRVWRFNRVMRTFVHVPEFYTRQHLFQLIKGPFVNDREYSKQPLRQRRKL